MKDDINCSYNDGGDAYLLQSVAIHFNHTVYMCVLKLDSVNALHIRLQITL